MSDDTLPEKKRTRAHPKITQPLSRIKVPKHISSKFAHYFVPHKRNAYKPLFLRIEMVTATTALILVLFVGATAVDKLLVTGSSPQVAAVVVATLIDLANTDRTGNGLSALTISPLLMEAAQEKADDEAAKGYFAHLSPSGQDPWYWFSQAGYNFTYAGENLAVYFSDSDAVNTAWMNSPEHRANILSNHFTQIGIATAQGMYQGVETTFVVQEFGTPADIAAVPASAVATTSSQSATLASTTASASNSAGPIAAGVVAEQVPSVKGASTETPQASTTPATVAVLQETPTFIAVKYIGAAAVPLSQNTAGTTEPLPPVPNPVDSSFWQFVTSPETDLGFAYGVIGTIVAMALILEIFVEVRRQHPHRVALGLSLISLMLILVYVGHTLIAGQLVIV